MKLTEMLTPGVRRSHHANLANVKTTQSHGDEKQNAERPRVWMWGGLARVQRSPIDGKMSDPHLGRGWSGAQTRGVAPKVRVVGAQNTTGGVCPFCETKPSGPELFVSVRQNSSGAIPAHVDRCPSAATISLLLLVLQYTCRPAVLVVTLTCLPLPLMATRFMRSGSLTCDAASTYAARPLLRAAFGL